MNRKIKFVICIVLLLLFAHTTYTCVAQDSSVYITILSSENKFDIHAQVSTSNTQNIISADYDDYNTYYLFLPAYAKGKPIKFDCGDNISIEVTDETNYHYLINEQFSLTILFGSKTPTIYLTLENDLSYITSDKSLTDSGQITFLNTDGSISYAGKLKEIKGRGNYTWGLPKKPFNIELDEKALVYDMPVAQDFALVASSDMSFIRNRISQELASAMNATSLDYTYVNLYINGEYQGIYELWERITPETLDIYDLEADTKTMMEQTDSLNQSTTGIHANDWNNTITGKWWDYEDTSNNVTGGYILESDYTARYDAEASGFIVDSGAYFVAKSPEYLSEKQYEYISNYVKECECVMYESVGQDNYHSLEKYIDIDSFIAKYLIEEISKNVECSSTSQFFYKDADGVLYAGPAWDYDSAYADDEAVENVNFEDPLGFCAREIPGTLVWWQLLYYNKAFYADMTETYTNVVYPYLSELTKNTIAEWKEELKASAIMDYLRWNYAASYEAAYNLYENEVNIISDFLEDRKEYLYNEWT